MQIPLTHAEQQAIDRALWSEIGLAIGRIEAKAELIQTDTRRALDDLGLRSVDFEHNLANHLKAMEERMAERIDTAYGAEFTQLRCLLDLTNKRQSALEDSLKHLHGKFALLNSRVAPIAQPKRKRERKHRKAA